MRKPEFQVGVPVKITHDERTQLRDLGAMMKENAGHTHPNWFYGYVVAHRKARAVIQVIMARSHAIGGPERGSGH